MLGIQYKYREKYKTPIGFRQESQLWYTLDDIPYHDEEGNVIKHKEIERPEQMHALKLIKPHHKVLELGGRYGTVSCVINNILKDPSQHVVVEPDSRAIPALMKNRDNHNCLFKIWNGVVSAKAVRMTNLEDPYSAQTESCDPQDPKRVPNVPLANLIQETGVRPNFLWADCEGGILDFLQENQDYVNIFDHIFFERDQVHRCDYAKVDKLLKDHGFVCKVEGFHTYWVHNSKA